MRLSIGTLLNVRIQIPCQDWFQIRRRRDLISYLKELLVTAAVTRKDPVLAHVYNFTLRG